MQKPGDHIGRILPGTIQKSSGKFKGRTLLNNIKVFQYQKTICGLYLEYDKMCDCQLLPHNIQNYETKINLNLSQFKYGDNQIQ